MGRSTGRPLLLWFGVVLLVALISLVVDQTTGDATGPPYHDPLINQVAFFIFLATIPTMLVLAGVAVTRFVRRPAP
ncbi:MAG: hypothetical protein M3O88_00230 [Actinomycetota bacterium]|nr:hypothetical protein [Actinomycetota bacterium]